jgi:hypothetical protein
MFSPHKSKTVLWEAQTEAPQKKSLFKFVPIVMICRRRQPLVFFSHTNYITQRKQSAQKLQEERGGTNQQPAGARAAAAAHEMDSNLLLESNFFHVPSEALFYYYSFSFLTTTAGSTDMGLTIVTVCPPTHPHYMDGCSHCCNDDRKTNVRLLAIFSPSPSYRCWLFVGSSLDRFGCINRLHSSSLWNSS